jgi:hypothetical protein
MSKTYKKYIFINSHKTIHEISEKALETLFKTTAKLDNITNKKLIPLIDIVEIPDDFFEYLLNSISVKKGIASLAKSIVVFQNLNAKILCISKEELTAAVDAYEETLQGLMDKTTQYLSEISNQVVILDNFKNSFLR